ncbi:MAG TPA: hypothetical protein VD993_15545 [Chitinophagaceae bacterium]|nr:hypothetical protein [Chitinophagaceae bacterium]
MNITQAKQIPLRVLVEHLGGRFSRYGRAGELWYYSPFRPNERTPSFKIDEKRNQWHDFARTEKVDAHGDIIDLWTDYHNKPRRDSQAVKDALIALEQFSTTSIPLQTYRPAPSQRHSRVHPSPRYQLSKKPTRIWKLVLKQELLRRGLDVADVHPLLRQALVIDTKTGKTHNGFAFENDQGGYDISIPNPITDKSFKTSVGKKWITTIPGPGETAQVYEGFWDFYTWVRMNKGHADHTHIVLNSASNVRMAADYITAQQTIRSVLLSWTMIPPGKMRRKSYSKCWNRKE